LSIRELLRRATVDDLTSLSNRGYLIEQIDATFRDPLTADVPHGLVTLGLDGFSQINDSYGHDAGEAVLVAVGARLRQLCRPGDVVCRLGADQFAAWCRYVDENAVPGLIGRLASVFAAPVEFGEHSLDVTGSLGATSTSFGRDPLELLRQADTAMYRARASGGDRSIIFDEVMAAEPQERRAREHELRHALDTEQFVLHFQPIVDLNTSAVVGMEALARWEHPRLGEIQPHDFMPLIDSALLRGEFDTAMIAKACVQLAAWQDELDRPLSVWVNVSDEQLSRSFVDDVSNLVLDLELTAERLVIELTEGVANATPQRVAVLESLKSLGVRIAIDDLGTDETDLSYLGDLPIDVIKLDKEFVQAIAARPERLALAESVIMSAHTLDVEVVAEGIETKEDLQALHQLGCDHAQGHLLARPLPAADLPSINLYNVIDLR
jgi:diguanylate cyclase (GGDEF)-like protein